MTESETSSLSQLALDQQLHASLKVGAGHLAVPFFICVYSCPRAQTHVPCSPLQPSLLLQDTLDLEVVQQLLAAGADANSRDPANHNATPLHKAAALLDPHTPGWGEADLVTPLVGPLPLKVGKPGTATASSSRISHCKASKPSPMHLPAQATLAVVVTRALHQALLMCNSHVSALQVPLLELLQLLVEAGADVTAQDALGQTPLQVALSNGNTACVGFLALRE